MLAVIAAFYATLVFTTANTDKDLPFFWSVVSGTDAAAHHVARILKDLTSTMERRISQLEVELKEMKEENKRLRDTVAREQVKERRKTFESEMTCNDTDIEDRLQQLELLVKNRTARTCHQLKRNGIKTSGFYFIDPDGVGVSEGPIKVFCDMETGATEIYHDSMDTISVTRCGSAGCYERKIDYGVPLSQIEALTGLSTSCSQTIRFDCMMTALNREDIPFGWWEDRSGSEKYYWHGNNSVGSIASCKCSMENSCQFPNYMCNCDGLFPTSTYDEGELTNKTSLPVTSLHYGGIMYELQEANHTLGPLKCKGEAPTPLGVSCESLRIDGATVSGYYIISPNGGSELELVFCDMTRSPTDVDFDRTVGELHVGRRKGVAFAAFNPRLTISGIFRFSSVDLDESSAINNFTGKFTAPQAGLYVFSAIITDTHHYVRRYTELYVDLHVGETSVVTLKPTADPEKSAAETIVTYLQEGDVVYLRKRSGDASGIKAQFSGFQLY